jgi:hypothetical protein
MRASLNVPTRTGGDASGTWGINITGNSATATTLQTARLIGGTSFNGSADITPFRANTIPTIDGGTIQASSTTYAARSASSNPNQYAYGVNWEFKNASVVSGTGNYAGLLTLAPWLSTTASTGDPAYQLAFSPAAANSTSAPTLKLRAGIDTTWGSWSTIWHSGNDGAGSGLDADLLDGLQLHAGTNNEANKVVRTDGNGYIQAGWINTTSGDNGTTAITRVYASQDGYIRYYTPTNFRTVLDVPTRTGGNASGTWGISITGNAATATTATDAGTLDGVDSSQFLRSDTADTSSRMIAFYTNMSSQEDYINSPISIRERDIAGAGDGEDRDSPNLNFHWGGRASKSLWMGANGWLNWGEYNATGIPAADGTLRAGNFLVSSSNHQVWHSGNDGSGSGLDADLLDGLNQTSANTASTIVARNSSGNIFANQVVGGTGTAIGSAGLVVNGTTGDNDSQLIIKKPSQSSFGVLTWDGSVLLSTNIYYENGAWIHSAPTGDNDNQLFVLSPGGGARWYASNNGSGSWNVASDLQLWNDSGVWQRPLANTLTLNTSGIGLSGSTAFNNSGAATFTVTSNATSANTASTIVARDASGNFSAGTITATLSGNASSATTAAACSGNAATATTLQTARTINGTSFNGSANITITANTPNTLTLNTSGTGLSGSTTFNGGSATTFTVTSNATSANTASTIVARDASGNFTAGTITATTHNITADTNNRFQQGALVLRGTSPTVYFRDTDHNSAMIHCNSNILYVLRGANDSETWTQVNGVWPLSINLTNNAATFGGSVAATSFSAGGNTVWHAGNDGSGSGLDADLLDGLNAATTGANTVVRTDGSGNIAASGNVTAYSSDMRLKENFSHIETPLEKVQKLNGYTFDWNEKSEELGFVPQHKKNDIGLIAQEVQDVLPQATALAPFDTKLGKDGETISKSGENYLTIQYERLVPLLVEAIKEQQNQINSLKQQINELKN